MKGYVHLKNTENTRDLIQSCMNIVSNLSLDQMDKAKHIYHKWSWSSLWWEEHIEYVPVANFLYQHRKSVLRYLHELQDMVDTGNDVNISVLAYNELVKLSKGDIEVNSYWILDY